jgi:GGDEF domain-containing protein
LSSNVGQNFPYSSETEAQRAAYRAEAETALYWKKARPASARPTVMIISAAGYRDSPLSYAFFLVAVSAALRYGYRSLLVVGFFVTCDWINKASAPTAPDAPFIIRSVFLCLTAILTSYIYGQVHKTQTALLRQEINEAAAINEALEHQAQHDLLTLLPNRALLQISLEQAIQTYDTSGVTQALLLMDLDRFKDVNDTFGHRFGDLLLQQIGPRAREVLGPAAAGFEVRPVLRDHRLDRRTGERAVRACVQVGIALEDGELRAGFRDGHSIVTSTGA